MPYLPITVPGPKIDEVNAPFWENCSAHRLTFQQCGDCGHLVHPPLPICPRCQSLHRVWKEAPSLATVFSFTWMHTAAHDSVVDCLPYNAALVEFPELPGVRLVTNVVDVEPGDLAIGDEVRLIWETGGNDQALPRFSKHGQIP
jgi:uncharacterized OB-fold protein